MFHFYFTTFGLWLLAFFQIKFGKKRICFTLSHVAQLNVNTKLGLALVPSYCMDGICLLEFKGRASIISFFHFLPPHNIAYRKGDIDAIWKLFVFDSRYLRDSCRQTVEVSVELCMVELTDLETARCLWNDLELKRFVLMCILFALVIQQIALCGGCLQYYFANLIV